MGLASTRIGPGSHLTGSGVGWTPANLSPVFWVDAALSGISGGQLVNLGTGGSALNATFGNTTGVDTFDPAYLPYAGTNYHFSPEVLNNYMNTVGLSTPGWTELDVRGAVRIRTNTGGYQIINKDDFATARDWNFSVSSTGFPSLFTNTGGGLLTSTCDVAVTTNTLLLLRATWRGVDGQVQFFSKSGVSEANAAAELASNTGWVQAGANKVGALGTLQNLQNGFTMNGSATGGSGDGFAYTVGSTVGSTSFFSVSTATGITSGSQTSFTCTTGQTINVVRSTSGRKSVAVTRPTLLFGGDDYLEVANNAALDFNASQSMTALAIFRSWATPTAFGRLLDRADASVVTGWTLQLKSDRTLFAQIGDGVNLATRSGVSTIGASGTLSCAAMVVDRTAQTIASVAGSTISATASTSTVGSPSLASVMAVGKSAAGITYQDMELVAAAVFRQALTANDIAAIVAYYGAS